jgi:hypothetical protein
MTGDDAGMRIPADDASDLDWLSFRQSGVVTWRQAAALLSPGRVRGLVASGRWQRPYRGVLVTHSGTPDPRQQLWIAVLAAGREAVLAGLAAARECGLRRVRSGRADVIDVYVPATSRAPDLLRRLPAEMPAVFVHRTRYLPQQDRQRAQPIRTTIERSLVDAAQWAVSDDDARMVLAAGCQQRLVAPSDLLEVVGRMPNVRRRRLIRQTIDDLAGGAEALSEIDLARLCRRFGLPAPKHQERRKDAAGRVRYLDAYWPEWHLHVEVDGAHHMEVAQWEADMRRQNEVWVAGDRILRFSAFQTRHRQAGVAEQIRRALLAAGWPG